MNPNKAPGPDGMTPLLFQKYQSILKKEVVNAIKSFFHSNHMLKEWNHTINSQIPKIDCLIELQHYRPISLCNVLYKAISKILFYTIKPILCYCIIKNQSPIVPNKQILDNIIISHESIHYLKNKRQGKQDLWL